jgi:hypothetical protein
LNTYEEEKKKHEDQVFRHGGLFGDRGSFFSPFGGMFGGSSGNVDPNQQQNDLQDFFQRFQEEVMSSSSPSSSSSSRRIFSSGSSVSIRESSLDGAQIDVQLPRGSSIHDVAVDVVQEYPCVVQYRIDQSNDNRKNKGGHPIQNQVRLGDYIDCGKVSASVSKARNLLTVKAPVQEKTAIMEQKVRSVLVTENDHSK